MPRRHFASLQGAAASPAPDHHPSIWLGHFFMRPPLRYGRRFTPTALRPCRAAFTFSCAARPHFPPQRQNTMHRMPLFRFALRRSFVACRAGCLPHPDRHPSVWLGHFFMRPPLRYGRKFTPTALRPWRAAFTFLYAVSASL